MHWREAVLEALPRMSLRHDRHSFTRPEIIHEELQRIVRDTAATGQTPDQTLSYYLQELRDEGYLEFDGNGAYTLLSSPLEPVASDIPLEYPTPARCPATIHRILRCTAIVGELKRQYGYKCQICATRLTLSPGFYCEAHHLKPLGVPHIGPDVKDNIVIVCPNHHVLLDYGAIRIGIDTLQLNRHRISDDFINYHNQFIYGRAQRSDEVIG